MKVREHCPLEQSWRTRLLQLFVILSHVVEAFSDLLLSKLTILEPVHEKTNNLGSNQVRHKPGCTVTEDG